MYVASVSCNFGSGNCSSESLISFSFLESHHLSLIQQVSPKLRDWRDLFWPDSPMGYAEWQEDALTALSSVQLGTYSSGILSGHDWLNQCTQSHIHLNGWQNVFLELGHALSATGEETMLVARK